MTRLRERRPSEGGQALPEFALIAPLFFLILFGIIQLGFLFAGQNGMTNAAREAARYASTLPTPDTFVSGSCATAGTNAATVYNRLVGINLLQYLPGYRASNLTSGTGGLSSCGSWALAGTGTGVGYCRSDNGDGTFSVRVRVAVVYRHPLFIPLVGRLFSNSDTWQLAAIEEMRVEGPNRSNSASGGFTTCP
ncbi:MAG TPA: TadE family protein [Candidatus Limnocylindrales bacterium]|nr:TadE family protein [Candidatus Limnocylindrales bacterium]